MRLGLGIGLGVWHRVGVSTPDVTAPVINSFTYDAPTRTASLDITEATGTSTVAWATSDTTVTPTFTVGGGWVGVTYETGTFTATSGGDTDVISITGTTPDGSRKITIYAYDAAGNLSAPANVTATIDNTAATLSSAILAADGVTLTLTYNETLAGTAVAGNYTVEADAVGVSVSTATRTGSTVVLGLAAAINSGQVVTVSYTGTAITDAFGNAVGGLTDQAVTNNSTQGAVFDPSVLFGAAEAGGIWDLQDGATLFQNSDETVPATSGNTLGSVSDLSGNANRLFQVSSAQRPTLNTIGGINRAVFDSVDDGLEVALQLQGAQWTVAMAITPAAVSFLLLSYDGGANPWIGAGASGSTSTSLASNATINSIYIDNVLFTGTTRGDLYTAVQSATTVIVDFSAITSTWEQVKYGSYFGGGFYAPGDLHAMVLISRAITTGERSDLHSWLSARV